MSKYILITEEEEKDFKVRTTGKAKVFYSFKSAYKAFRKSIVNKIATDVPYFGLIWDGDRIKTDFVFQLIDEEDTGYTEEYKQNANNAIDVVYNTVTDEKYVFSGKIDLKYRDSEMNCLCDKDSIRFLACGTDNYDIVSNAHFPPDKNRQYYFYYEWYGEEYSNCSFTLRLFKADKIGEWRKCKMNKYIFFDIDGVLNNNKTVYDGKSPVILDDKNLKNLRKVVDSTSAKLVMISSHKDSWVKSGIGQGEKGNYLDEKFADFGMVINDKTSGGFYQRGKSIKEYIELHPCKSFVILDDNVCDYKEEELSDLWVKPSAETGGLTKDLTKIAIAILNKNK